MKKTITIDGEKQHLQIQKMSENEVSFSWAGEVYTYTLLHREGDQITLRGGAETADGEKMESCDFEGLFFRQFQLRQVCRTDPGAKNTKVHQWGPFGEVWTETEKKISRSKRGGSSETTLEGGEILAPMPGKIFRLLCAQGDRVEKGQVLIIVEAMKMEHELRAPFDGVVETLKVGEGQAVELGAQLLKVGPISSGKD